MKNLGSLLFVDSYPKLDLHGYDRETARVALDDFIRDNKKMKNEIVVIVHGIGSGILKETTKITLTRNKNVSEFAICYNNVGCTIVRIIVWLTNKNMI